jgi:hypothetical protein
MDNSKPQVTSRYLNDVYLDLDQEFDDVIADLKNIQDKYHGQFDSFNLEVSIDNCNDLEIAVIGVRMETVHEAEGRVKRAKELSLRLANQKRERYEELKKEFGE